MAKRKKCNVCKKIRAHYVNPKTEIVVGKCNDCMKLYKAKWKEKNKSEIEQYHQEYYEKNKLRLLQNVKKYAINNRERIYALHKKWRDNNKEKIAVRNKLYYEKEI